MECRFIEGFEDYLIFADGNVYSRRNQKMLRPVKDTKGYHRVTLCKDGIETRMLVHRLVAKAFIPNPENKPQVNHLNGIKADCRKENLEWATGSENRQHAFKTGLSVPPNPCKRVGQYTRSGELIATYPSIIEAERSSGVWGGNISKVCLGRLHHKTAGGFVWRFVEE